MEKRKLGNSDMHITPVGYGAWATGGGGWAFSWGEQDDKDSIAAIRRALEMGMNWIDTAAVYGLGHSEEVVARALEGIPAADRPYVFTKCEMVWDKEGNVTGNLKADSIRRECEDSLRRLKIDTIDLYQIHWPNPEEDIEEGWSTVVELQKAGKVRWIGVSNFNAEQMKRAQKIAPITSLQPPYSMMRRAIEESTLPHALETGVGVIVYSPMQSGLLTGAMTKERAEAMGKDDWRSRNPEFKEPKLSKNLDLVEGIRAIGKRHDRSPGEVAIAWTLNHPAITAAIVGARNPEQVDGIIGAGEWRLTKEEINEIEALLEKRNS
ncbi:aldo/keto reductase [candidate division BRC1 bacterium HGW-BRC1-1]|jgi:aryl-alcohol dehydrogenase-like predicted oxidoreductase|nr:MAG: aldo/keto reductase [candidate division BRC1 bacterium HGW-BRC1-1]